MRLSTQAISRLTTIAMAVCVSIVATSVYAPASARPSIDGKPPRVKRDQAAVVTDYSAEICALRLDGPRRVQGRMVQPGKVMTCRSEALYDSEAAPVSAEEKRIEDDSQSLTPLSNQS